MKTIIDKILNNSIVISILGIIQGIWRFIRIPVAIITVLFIGLVIYRVPVALERQETEKVVAKIHAQKLTLADVLGQNLPMEPNALLKDNTIEGIDVNENGIRDDVELAIFRLHPDSARIRAAELQYAMALQMEINEVFNKETWEDAVFEESRGYACISETHPRTNLKEFLAATKALVKEVEDLQYNTEKRIIRREKISAFTTGFGLPNKDFCLIDSKILPN